MPLWLVLAAALPDAKMAADDVVLPVKRKFRAHQTNAAARSRLPGNGQAAAGRHGGQKIDVAANVKNDDAIGLAHRVAERTRAAVVGVGHMINRAADAPAVSRRAETQRAGKCGDVRLHRRDNQIHLAGRVGVDACATCSRAT